MINIYGSHTTLDELKTVQLKTPAKAGGLWKGISHHHLATTIMDELETRGIEVEKSQFSLAKKGANCVGAFDLNIPSIDSPEGTQYSLGFMNYNDLCKPLELISGANVTICHNGMVTGTQILRKRHTHGLQLFNQIDAAVSAYLQQITSLEQIIEDLKEFPIPKNKASDLILEAGRRDLLPWTRIKEVDAEYRNPTHPEHGTGTRWALLQAFTQITKKSPPNRQMEMISNLQDFVMAA